MTRTSRGPPLLIALALLLMGCAGEDGSTAIVDAAIEKHGGDRFEHSRTRFGFRGATFEIRREDGRFSYRRTYRDQNGREVTEGMDNDGTWMTVDGAAVQLGPSERTRVEEAVNSVVYFAFLPFRLGDPAVRTRDLGPDTVEGEPYRRIEVTFREEGGGEDWDDRFVHWIHRDEHTLDYFAYRYERNEGGTRFRRAVNRREVGGLLLQDHENYRATAPVEDVAEYGRLFEAGNVEEVSLVELEEVEVAPVGRELPP